MTSNPSSKLTHERHLSDTLRHRVGLSRRWNRLVASILTVPLAAAGLTMVTAPPASAGPAGCTEAEFGGGFSGTIKVEKIQLRNSDGTNIRDTCQITFTSGGTWTVPYGVTSVDVLVTGGGGGGGGGAGGGGGGGGFVNVATGVPVSYNTALPVTVGVGGAGGAQNPSSAGTNGGSSSFGSLTAAGGGAGGTGTGKTGGGSGITINGVFTSRPGGNPGQNGNWLGSGGGGGSVQNGGAASNFAVGTNPSQWYAGWAGNGAISWPVYGNTCYGASWPCYSTMDTGLFVANSRIYNAAGTIVSNPGTGNPELGGGGDGGWSNGWPRNPAPDAGRQLLPTGAENDKRTVGGSTVYAPLGGGGVSVVGNSTALDAIAGTGGGGAGIGSPYTGASSATRAGNGGSGVVVLRFLRPWQGSYNSGKPPAWVTPAALPGATRNTAYSANLTVEAWPQPTFVVKAGSTLPPGLSVAVSASDPATFVLSGTPTTAGTYNFTISATGAMQYNANPSAPVDRAFSLTVVSNTAGVPTITTSTPTGAGSVGKVSIAVTNGTGATPTSYVVQYRLNGTTAWTTLSPDPTTSPITISGLTPGVYNFQVASKNAAGTSAYSPIVNGTSLGVTTPAAPSTLAGDAKVTVSVVPAATGAIPTSYVIQALQGGSAVSGKTCTVTPPATSCQVLGLTNGTAYTFTTTAYTGTDASQASPQSLAATPRTVPGAPTSVTATPLDGAMSIAFTAPASNGGSDITNYQYSINGGVSWTALSPADATSPITLSGLVNGQGYSVTLRAVNAAGVGASSIAAAGTPKAAGPPDAPTGLVATANSGSAQVAFTAGADNGSPITDYMYSLDGGTWTTLNDTTSPVTIPGLVNDTAYSIRVRAVNALGDGAISAPVTVTPRALPPSAPTGLVATAGDDTASVSFTPPASDGGGTITNYQYSLDGGVTWTPLSPVNATSPVTIPNLVNGTPYVVQLRAVNTTGPGAASSSVSVTPVGVPDAPVNLVATAKNGEAQIAFTPGASNGSAITNYKYSLDNGGTWTALDDTTSPVTIPSLTNSTLYTIQLKAMNAVGGSLASTSVSVTPMPLPPSAPTITTATRGDAQATITFTAPTSDGGGAITDYKYSIDGGVTWTALNSTASPFTVSGLANGTQYSFTLRAKNVSGPGAPSIAATVTPAGLPGAPVFVTSMPLDGAVSLMFTPGTANGSAITNYEYKIGGGSWTALNPADIASPVIIPGLTNGTGYNIGLRAINGVGPSPDWNGTAVVQVPCGTPTKPTALVATPGTSQATITFTNANANGTPILNYQYSLDNGASWIAFSPAVVGSPVVVSGLDQRIAYDIKLRAMNAAGNGIESDAVSVTIANLLTDRVPAAPTALGATPSDRAASIAFTAPPTGSNVPESGVATPAITNYEYSTDEGATWIAFSAPQASSPVSLSALNNGQLYSVRLRAVNSAGPGAVSEPVSVTPAVLPAAPTSLAATANSGSAQIAFAAGYNGGSPITNYKFCLSTCGSPGSWTALSPDDSTSPVTIPGLTNGTTYTIKLRAANAIGDSLDSASVTATPRALPPSAPTGLVAIAGDDTASVSFTPPASDGGGTITNYQYSLDGGVTWTALSPDDSTSPVTIPNLVNGTPYAISLRAVNATGAGAASAAAPSVIPMGRPGAPTSLEATANSGSAQIAFTAGSDNGSPITNYTYSLNGTTWTALSPDDTTSPITIPALTNLTTYTIKLRAVNSVGESLDSVSVSVTPLPLPPSAPTGLSATRGDREATVSFTPPASDGGGTITNYEYSLDGGVTWTALSPDDSTSPVTIPNLVNGNPYAIALRAVNSTGAGAASSAASVVTPAGPPGAPTNPAAVPQNASALMAFTAGSSNGAPITNYEYSVDGGANWTALSPLDDSSPVTIPGLTNGTAYTVTLRARNAVGESVASGPVSVTPSGPPSEPTTLEGTPLDDAAEVAFTLPTSDGGAPITNYQYSLDGGVTWISLSPVDGASPVMIPGLTNGVQSDIILRAVNAGGVGAASTSLTVTPAAAPAAPTALIASPQSDQATISFTPGPDNGSAITEYLYSLDGGANWSIVNSTDSPVTVSGLTNGTAYTVKLRAQNAVGVGTISLPVSVTPNAPTPPNPGPPGPGPTPPPTPTPTPTPVPIPAPLDPGESELTIDGTPRPVKVDPNTNENGLNVQGDGWTMDLDGLGPDGKPLDLGPDGVLRVQVGRNVQTEGTGFKPDSVVGLFLNPPIAPSNKSSSGTWLRSLLVVMASETPVGMVRVNAQGLFLGTATLPRDIKPGKHVLQAVGFGPGGDTRALSIGVIVEASLVLNQGVRTKGTGRIHDRINTTGSSTGIEPGTRLTPYIKYTGQKTFTKGKASIVVAADGTFRWTRQIRRDKGVTGYVAYLDAFSNQITWVKLP